MDDNIRNYIENLLAYLIYEKVWTGDEQVMSKKPTIVCLCGSTRFSEVFAKAQLEETLAGKIVLTIGCNIQSDDQIFGHMSEEERAAIKAKLDELHLRKIDLANEVLVLNVGGYIGESTANEIKYARSLGKELRWLERKCGHYFAGRWVL